MEIFNEYSFDSAHFLPNLPKTHKCGRLHGHTYRVKIYISGDIDEEQGWLIDFGDLAKAVQPVIDELDHRFLNDIKGLENPTCENIARWIWQRLKSVLPNLSKIIVTETMNSGCVYAGENLS